MIKRLIVLGDHQDVEKEFLSRSFGESLNWQNLTEAFSLLLQLGKLISKQYHEQPNLTDNR